MAKILQYCPTCQARMEVTQLSCTACETVVLGRFEPCRFCNLSPEHLALLESFLRNRGNVKDMERELGTSYWTIRTRINEMLEELELDIQPPQVDQALKRKEILEQLRSGDLTPDTANQMLKDLYA